MKQKKFIKRADREIYNILFDDFLHNVGSFLQFQWENDGQSHFSEFKSVGMFYNHLVCSAELHFYCSLPIFVVYTIIIVQSLAMMHFHVDLY